MKQPKRDTQNRTTSIRDAEPLLYRLPDVLRMIGIGKSTLYEMIKTGQFPRPVHVGPRAVAWRAQDIKAWANSLEQQPPR